MLTRFELFVIARNQLSDRTLLRRYLAVEAGMAEIAERAGLDPLHAVLAGLGSGLDAQLCRFHPERRGEVARDYLLTEAAPVEVQDAVLASRKHEVAGLSSLAAALVVIDGLVGQVYQTMELDECSLDQLGAREVVRRIERKASRRDDPEARRVLAAAARLGLDPTELAGCTIAAMSRIRMDLGL